MTPLDSKRGRLKKLLMIAGPVLIADQASKALVVRLMPLFDSIEMIPGFFSLTHIKNPGGAFGFMANSPPGVRLFVFIFVSIVALFFILHMYLKTPGRRPLFSSGLALVFGGALGNIADRVRFGEVTDFFDFYLKNAHWPAFNVADASIVVGVSIVAWHLLFKKDAF
ncbi:Lipoprotein signal peptidase [Candidatus Desulfarcum epimagneticum]|uniref:Lipoprotein signal peptidase n=1 Tax=uncultured Desulfobacteraceae bacterium TaxID=218296 RepID=A0A484HL23_9BACT|nr:Lipoprotein signal peptidase [uncultured Desulfobacteraceae bacterium]